MKVNDLIQMSGCLDHKGSQDRNPDHPNCYYLPIIYNLLSMHVYRVGIHVFIPS